MAGVWCDVLLVRFSAHGCTRDYSIFYPVPFSSGGLTIQRVLDIESALNAKAYVNEANVLGCELLNEMLVEEDKVETIISRPEMETILLAITQ